MLIHVSTNWKKVLGPIALSRQSDSRKHAMIYVLYHFSIITLYPLTFTPLHWTIFFTMSNQNLDINLSLLRSYI